MRVTVRNAAQGCVMLTLSGTGFLFVYLMLALLLIKHDAREVCNVDVTRLFWRIGASHAGCAKLLTIMARPLGVERAVRFEIIFYDDIEIGRQLEAQYRAGVYFHRGGTWTPRQIDGQK